MNEEVPLMPLPDLSRVINSLLTNKKTSKINVKNFFITYFNYNYYNVFITQCSDDKSYM